MEISSINNLDDNGNSIAEKYDFNKDGKVDIEDYNLAISQLKDDISSNDPDISETELKKVFSSVINTSETPDDTDITAENIVQKAAEIISKGTSGLDPNAAKTLNELQNIGISINTMAKRCSSAATLLDQKINYAQQELDKIIEEKTLCEREYADKAQEISNKQVELAGVFNKIASESSYLKSEKESNTEAIIAKCVTNYKNGKCGDKSLKDVITEEISSSSGYDTSILTSALGNAGILGEEINSLCSDIEKLVGNIKNINSMFELKSNEISSYSSSRKQVVNIGQIASNNYQKGYNKRLELRNELITKYSAEAIDDETKIASGENPQMQKLADFLNNKELDKMPYDDAMVVMKAAFSGCGIEFNEETKEITLPWGSDNAGSNILTALDDALYRNYAIKTTRPKYDQEDNQKVYIISGYNNTCYAGLYRNNKLTVGENIKDFAGQSSYSWARSGIFSGSGVHDHDKGNNEEWMTLYNKLSDEVKNMTIEKGEAYIVKEDGTLIGIVATDQLGKMGYSASYRSDASVYNDNFEVLSSLNVDGGYGASEEGAGGTICFNGKAYDVAQTIARKETPLILDLKGDGLKLTDMNHGVNFDLNADGTMDRTAWTETHTDFDDAFLVFDKNGDGQINDGKELFGSQNGAINGFAELSKYDSNDDGKIDKNDDNYNKFQLWSDMNGDGKADDGELRSLEEMGVAEISTKYNEVKDSTGKLIEDKNGNTTGLQGGFTLSDGTKNKMTDVLFKTASLDDYYELHNIDSATGEIKRKEESNLFADEVFTFETKQKQYKQSRLVDNHEKVIRIDNTSALRTASCVVDETITELDKEVTAPNIMPEKNVEDEEKTKKEQ